MSETIGYIIGGGLKEGFRIRLTVAAEEFDLAPTRSMIDRAGPFPGAASLGCGVSSGPARH